MREFIDGNDMQYKDLRQRLQDERCHVFNNCELPSCCSKRKCRIGFEKDNGVYKLLIDLGITCSKMRGGIQLDQFRQLLEKGELQFIDFNDMRVFLKSLGFLYE